MDREEMARRRAETANTVSTQEAVTVVQAGTIQGGLTIRTGEASGPAVPSQLVAPPRHFVGRQRELEALRLARERQGPSVAVLTGPAGVGKTALARRWAHEARAGFPDGLIESDLGGFGDTPPPDPSEVLGSFLRALGLAAARVPATLAEQVALYRTWTADRALLLLLHDAVSAAQVRVLLPAGPGSATLVTSRRHLQGLLAEGAAFVQVGPLEVDDSVRLLAESVGHPRVHGEQEHAAAIAQLCGGLPVALNVVASRLVTRPHLTLSRLAEELRLDSVRLARLETGDGLSVRSTFDTSYQSLEPAAAMLYRRLSADPGRELGVQAIGNIVRGMGTEEDAAILIDVLVGASLLQEIAEDTFRFHDLVRLHAARLFESEEQPEIRRGIVLGQLEWHLAAARNADRVITPYRRVRIYQSNASLTGVPEFVERSAALAWLEQELITLVTTANKAFQLGYYELTWHVSDALWSLFLYSKHYSDRRRLDELGVRAAREWHDPAAEAEMLKRLGRSCTTAGEFDAAYGHFVQAMSLWGELGDKRGETDTREMIAALHRDSGRPAEAVAEFEAVLAANRRLADARHVGMTLISLGSLLPEVGRAPEAVERLAEAREIFNRLSDVDPYNAARVDIALAAAYLAAGDAAGSETAALRGLEGMRRLGSGYEEGQALEVLLALAHERGDRNAAEKHRAAALRAYEAVHSPRAGLLRAAHAATDGVDPAAVEDLGDSSPGQGSR